MSWRTKLEERSTEAQAQGLSLVDTGEKRV